MSISNYTLEVDTSFNPPKVTVVPYAADQWYVQGKRLMTPHHQPFQVRGVEQAMWYEGWFDLTATVDGVGAAGANTMRIVPFYQTSPPSGGRLNLPQIELLMGDVISWDMLLDVAIDGGKNHTTYVTDGSLRGVLQDDAFFNVLHAKGEGTEGGAIEWRTNAIKVVQDMRSAGYKQPLYILSNEYGRNLPTILAEGQKVLDADPMKSVVFGWQAYWGSSNYYQNKYGMSMTTALQKVIDSPLCIQVGIMEHSDPGKPEVTEWKRVIDTCNANGIGWLWWDWRLGPDNIGYGTYSNTPVAQYVKSSLRGATKWSP